MSIKLEKYNNQPLHSNSLRGCMARQGALIFVMEESMGLTTSQFCNTNGRTAGRARVALDGSSFSKTTHNTPKNVNNNQLCIGNVTELTAIAMPTLKKILIATAIIILREILREILNQ